MNNWTFLKSIAGIAFVFILFSPGHLSGQEASNSDNLFPLYDNLGTYSRAVSTDSELAQAYFDQGLRLAYSFARAEAAESFRAAQHYDPDCAMCYWGEAWVLGPYQNNPAGVGEYGDAIIAAQKALGLADGAEPWEQALIAAMAARYPDPGNGDAATEDYAVAMEAVAESYTANLEAGTLYAESLILYRPWNLYRESGEPYAETMMAIEMLETILEKDLDHPGACHLYIHAVEAWQPERAENCADVLAGTVPGVAHMQHMPSHIYVHIGRYGDAVHRNQKARLVLQASKHNEGIVVYQGHNTGMLIFAAWLDGQSGVAISAARDMAMMNPDEFFQYDLQLARFGRWDLLINQEREQGMTFHSGLSRMAYGLAQLRTGNPEMAKRELERIRAIRKNTSEDATYGFFQFSQQDLLGMAENILAGEIAATDNQYIEAEEYLREAIRLEDRLPYSEPEPWPIPARHVLGAVLLEAGQAADAEIVYREDLQNYPENGWSLKGLVLSLEAQGKSAEAEKTRLEFEKAWQRADVYLKASRF